MSILSYVVVNVTHPNIIGEFATEETANNVATECRRDIGDVYIVCPKRWTMESLQREKCNNMLKTGSPSINVGDVW